MTCSPPCRRLLSWFTVLVLAAACGPGALGDGGLDALEGEVGTAFLPVADTFVDSARPRTAFGAARTLEADSLPSRKRVLLRFRVSGVGSAVVTRAVLKLRVVDTAAKRGSLFSVEGPWGEATTDESAPPLGEKLLDLEGPATSGTWITADVTSLVKGDRELSWYLVSDAEDGVDYASTESGFAPRLVVTTEPAALASCPAFSDRKNQGERESDALNEASGLVASRKSPGVLWTHDDSGDSARLFAMGLHGEHLGIYPVSGASARDWEDIGLARLSDGAWYLVVGDIGDNQRSRANVQVYLVPEPQVSAGQAPVTQTLTGTRRLTLEYPGGQAHNAEGLFIDPEDGALYIVSKSFSGLSQVFHKPAPHLDGTTTRMTEVARIDFAASPLIDWNPDGRIAATGADIAPDGRELIVKTPLATYLWRRAVGATIAQALESQPCNIPDGPGEAVAFSPDGASYYTTSEATHAPLYRFDRQ
jgi:hypothetical protein